MATVVGSGTATQSNRAVGPRPMEMLARSGSPAIVLSTLNTDAPPSVSTWAVKLDAVLRVICIRYHEPTLLLMGIGVVEEPLGTKQSNSLSPWIELIRSAST